MNRVSALLALIVVAWGAAACAQTGAPLASSTPVAPIRITTDLSRLDVCNAIPQHDIEAAMGRKLASMPQPFQYYDTPGSSGCRYQGEQDPGGEEHFAYVAFTPLSAYKGEPLYQNLDVSGLGQEAYFNTGPDARQLWVKVADNAALVVAFGHAPNEEADRQIAELVLSAIR